MTQAKLSRAPLRVLAASERLTHKERYEMEQYYKIARFRDAVLSGIHPTIQLPIHRNSLPQASAPPAGAVADESKALPSSLPTLPGAKAQLEGKGATSRTAGSRPTQPAHSIPKPFGSGQTEISPVLLEKSEHLIRAEALLERQRLERSLKDDVEQRRGAKSTHADCRPYLNLSDVLNKALARVPASAATTSVPTGEDLTANHEAASDSFDENTFYSSLHETPQSQMTSRVGNESGEAQDSSHALHPRSASTTHAMATTGSHSTQGLGLATDSRSADSQDMSQSFPGVVPAHAAQAAASGSAVPGFDDYLIHGGRWEERQERGGVPPLTRSGPLVTDDSRPADPAVGDAGLAGVRTEAAARSSHQRSDALFDVSTLPPSPLVRGHTLQPVAPQPTQISPFVVSNRGQEAISTTVERSKGTSAQVAALRMEPLAVASPDTSSQGGRSSDKKKGKKKKRKVDRQAPEAEAAPYIKAESRSPSPLTGSLYARPNKRLRHAQGPVDESEYEPRYESYKRSFVPELDGRYLTRPYYRDQRVLVDYDGLGSYPQRSMSTAVVGESRYGPEFVGDGRILPDVYSRGYGLPGAGLASTYSPGVVSNTRPVSRTLIGDGYQAGRGLYQEYYPEGLAEASRASVRPDGEAYLVNQAKAGPAPVLVDAFGREYLEPPPPVMHHRVLASPAVGLGGAGVGYERLPAQALPRLAVADAYGDRGMVYGGPSAHYAMQRRMVTQPEPGSRTYRSDGRSGEYRGRSFGLPNDLAAASGARLAEEAGGGYFARAESTRPAEGIRYEAVQGYGRVQSARPEMAGREYGTSAHPEGVREATRPYMGDYSRRPPEPYPSTQMRVAGGEVGYMEAPLRGTHDNLYADEMRRDMYG